MSETEKENISQRMVAIINEEIERNDDGSNDFEHERLDLAESLYVLFAD